MPVSPSPGRVSLPEHNGGRSEPETEEGKITADDDLIAQVVECFTLTLVSVNTPTRYNCLDFRKNELTPSNKKYKWKAAEL